MFSLDLTACRHVRPSSCALALSLFTLVASGCDSHKAAAGARDSLGFTVKGTDQDLYGIEVVVMSGGQKLAEGPLGPDGRLVVQDAPLGEARITLRDLRGRFATQTVLVESPGEHEVPLVAGTVLRTTVRGEDEAVLDSVDIVASGGGADPRSFELSGPRASFGPLASGAFKLFVSAPGYQTRIVDLNVKRARTPGTVRDLPDLHLEMGGVTLRGTLAVDRRHRLPLRAFLRHGGASQEIEVRPDGSFALSGLPVARGALEATLVVRDDERELLARDLRIAADLDLGRISLR